MQEEKDLLGNLNKTSLFWAALGMGFLASWFFYGRLLGISFGLYNIIIVIMLLFFGKQSGVRPVRSNIWLWGAILFFSGMIFLRDNPILTAGNFLIVVILWSYGLPFWGQGQVSGLSLGGLVAWPWRTLGYSLRLVPPVATAALGSEAGSPAARRSLPAVFRGALLALPLLIVFGLLLASADYVFADYLGKALDLPGFKATIGRVLFSLLAAAVVAGGVAFAVRRASFAPGSGGGSFEEAVRVFPRSLSIGFTETATILVLVNALFLSFVLVQFTYLFGGLANIGDRGYTFAEYARRGFFEMVTVAALSLILILFLNWLTRRENKRQLRWFKLLGSFLVLLVLVILAAAYYRMTLYQDAFGATELRLMVAVFDVWLGLLLIWFLVSLWRFPNHFAVGFLAAGSGLLATLNLMNVDATIVQANLVRYQESGDLDVFYLTSLSDDAVPGLVETYAAVQGDDQEITYQGWEYECQEENDRCQTTLEHVLHENLSGRYEVKVKDDSWLAWQSYHQARYRAFELLERVVGEG